jgi:uncharacterized protein DUF2630
MAIRSPAAFMPPIDGTVTRPRAGVLDEVMGQLRSAGSDADHGSGGPAVDRHPGDTRAGHARSIVGMDDAAIFDQLRTLTDEEHRIREAGPEGDPARLQDIEVMLDQCWDLLRQRRAKREYGDNPDEAHVRDASVVERYQQ